jgi:hypothetical protein
MNKLEQFKQYFSEGASVNPGHIRNSLWQAAAQAAQPSNTTSRCPYRAFVRDLMDQCIERPSVSQMCHSVT